MEMEKYIYKQGRILREVDEHKRKMDKPPQLGESEGRILLTGQNIYPWELTDKENAAGSDGSSSVRNVEILVFAETKVLEAGSNPPTQPVVHVILASPS